LEMYMRHIMFSNMCQTLANQEANFNKQEK